MFKENTFHKVGLLEQLDLFGININIRFCKRVLHQTKFGGFITIFIFILLLLQIGLIISNILDSKNPTVLYEQTYTFQPERYNLTNDKFSLAFGIQNNSSQHFIDPSIYNVYIEFRKLSKIFNAKTNDYTAIWKNRKLQLEVCTQDHFQVKGTEQYFRILKFSQLYCISRKEDDLYIEGQFDSVDYSSLKIYVEICNENSPNQHNIKCKSDQEITDSLSGFRFAVYYIDNTVITRDRYHPFQPLGKQSFWISHPQFFKSLNINFRNSYLYTDNGLVMQDIEIQRGLTFSFDREQIGMRNGNTIIDCTILFEKSMNSNYHRSYAKLDKALSQVGGIYQILFAIGCLLCKPLSQLELNRKLMDSLFSFVNSDDQTEDNINNTVINNNQNKSNLQDKSTSPIIEPVKKQFDEITHNLTKSNFFTKKSETKNISLHEENLQLKQLPSINKSKSQPKSKNNEENSACKSSFDGNLESSEMKLSQVSKQKILLEKERSMLQSVQRNSVLQQQDKMKDKALNPMFIKRAQQSLVVLKDLFNQSFKEIQFRTKEYIISSCKAFTLCRKRKHKILNQGIDKLYQHIDIFYITTKLIEFEKLKNLILNQEQLKLFEFIPRPILEFGKKQSQNNQNKIFYDDKRNLVEKTLDAQESFNRILQKGKQMTQIDSKLIEILDPKLKQLLIEEEHQSNTLIPEDNADTHIFRNEVKDSLNIHLFAK